MFLQSPEVVSASRDPNTPTSSSSSSHISISVPKPIYSTQLVSSPDDTRRPAHHRMLGYRSDSTDSIERLGSGEMSSSRYKTLVAEPESSHLSSDLSRQLSRQETLICSPICVDDLEVPALSRSRIFPVAPEHFDRYEKRRKMYESNPFCSSCFNFLFQQDPMRQRKSQYTDFVRISQSKFQ